MNRTPEEFAQRYAGMSEVELMELAQAYDSLTEPAQAALRAEFGRRGLEPPLVEDAVQAAARTLITVRRYRDLSEAIVGRSLLQSAGIDSWVQDENLVRLDWAYSNLVGGIRLQVDEADAHAAEEVLSQPIPDAISFASDAEFVQPRCPRCGSLEISFLGADRGVALASVTLLALPLPVGDESWACAACGARWAETDDEEDGSPVKPPIPPV
jgi:hypothetical protein